MKKWICALTFLVLLFPAAGLGDTLRVKGASVELRAAPNSEARVIAYAGEGKEFEIEKTLASGWYSVRLPNNTVVWIERGEGIEVVRAPLVAEAPAPKKEAEIKKAEVRAAPEKEEKKPAERPAPAQAAEKVKEAAPKPEVKKPAEAAPPPAVKKEEVPVAEAKKEPPPAPVVAKKPEEEPAAEKPPAEGGAVEKKLPPPRFISNPQAETAATLLSRGPFLAVINLIFGALCLFLARRKGKSLLVWFTLGTYFTVISLIVILIKRRKEEPTATKMALKIVSTILLVIWFGVVGAVYMFTQNALRDREVIQEKVNIYTLQIHKKNYKGAFLLLSPETRGRIPYKKFVKTNETVRGALGALRLYQLTDFNIGHGDRPTTVVYRGKFERGHGDITFTLKKEGGLMGMVRPGEWFITSVETSSPRIQQYLRSRKKAS